MKESNWSWTVFLAASLAALVWLAQAARPEPPPIERARSYGAPLTPPPSSRACATTLAPGEVERDYAVIHAPDSWRFGVGVSAAVDQDLWLPRLGGGWYIDWQVRERPGYAFPEHWQTIRVGQADTVPSPEAVRWLAQRYPGQTWIIGNEPDVIWQDDVTPDRYALAYHDLYTALKAADPTAQVAAGAVAQATPLRLRYLDLVLEKYAAFYGQAMPVDVWTVHAYVLNEERGGWGAEIPPGLPDAAGEVRTVADHGDMGLFKSQIIAFRKWMAARGYQARPLAVTEYGIVMPEEYGFPPEQVIAFMRTSFDFFLTAADPALGDPADDDHLVQRWAWFSLADPLYPTSDLMNACANAPTALGLAYRDYVRLLLGPVTKRAPPINSEVIASLRAARSTCNLPQTVIKKASCY